MSATTSEKRRSFSSSSASEENEISASAASHSSPPVSSSAAPPSSSSSSSSVSSSSDDSNTRKAPSTDEAAKNMKNVEYRVFESNDNDDGKDTYETSVKDLSIRQYLDTQIVPVLLPAFAKLANERPEDPIDFLADYLKAHAKKNRKNKKIAHGSNQKIERREKGSEEEKEELEGGRETEGQETGEEVEEKE